jgi:hypothetical protein
LRKNIWSVALLLLMLLLTLSISSQARADYFWKGAEEKNFTINAKVRILDRDGHEQIVTECYDSFHAPYFVLCADKEGQSPLYRIDKKDVTFMEMDGYYTNMSGWEYVGVDMHLKNNRQKKGFIQVAHMGNLEYRTFNGITDLGKYMISWRRLKKIEFLGEWKMVPDENIADKNEGVKDGKDDGKNKQ